MKIFETVAQLKISKLKAGQLVETKGYYVAGDAGASRYLIVPSQTADEYGDHTLANGEVAVLQHNGRISACKFGARGDGSGGGSSTSNLQAVIDYAIANNYPTIELDGKFDITGGTLLIDKGIKHTEGGNDFARKRLDFVGAGDAMIIKQNGGFMFSANSASGDIGFSGVTFSGVIDNTGVPSVIGGLRGFDCDKLIRLTTINCTFRYLDDCYFQAGTVASAMQSIKAINNTYTKNKTILHFNTAWDVVFDGGLMEDGNHFLTCKDINSSMRNLVVSNGATIEGMRETAIELNCVNIGTKIVNCYFEANYQHIQMNRFNGCVAIENNSFFGRGNEPAGNIIKCIDVAVGGEGINVDGNISTETTANTILISVDETSVYNSATYNLVGTNYTSGATMTDTPKRLIPKNGLRVLMGVGSPEGVVEADPGFIYLSRSGGSTTTFYVKESGSGSTGWAGK